MRSLPQTAIGTAAIDAAVSSRDSPPGWLAVTLEAMLPAASACLCAWRMPRLGFLAGLSMAVPTAIAAAALNRAFELTGRPGDFRGSGGMLIVFEIVVLGFLPICAIGALAGWALGRWFKEDRTRRSR